MRAQKLFDTLAGQRPGSIPLTKNQEPATPAAPAARLNLTVLVTEDNPTGQLIATAMLEKMGCRADIASNGLEAVQMFEQKHYDLIFMDWHMPVMDGLEATVKIREITRQGRHVPIIAFTAGVPEAERETFLKMGVDDFILKPATRKTLEDVLRRWMPPPAAPLFNEEEALCFVDGDRDLLGQLAASFSEHAPVLLQNLQEAIARRDARAATIAAHTLKGSARMFAAPDTVAAALAAESAGKVQDWPGLAAAGRNVELELARLLPELAKIFPVNA